MGFQSQEIRNLIYQILRTLGSNDRVTCKCVGVTHLQGLILLELAQKQPLNMQQLAQQMQLAVSTISRVVDKLVDVRLINRQEDKGDRRMVVCTLTEKGQKIVCQLDDCFDNFFNQLVANIPPGDLTGFLKGLKVMVQQLQCCTPSCDSQDGSK